MCQGTIRMLNNFRSFSSSPPFSDSFCSWQWFTITRRWKEKRWQGVKMNASFSQEHQWRPLRNVDVPTAHEKIKIKSNMLSLTDFRKHYAVFVWLKDKKPRGWKQFWLTVWAAWLSGSTTRAGLCFDFLGLKVRSAGPLCSPCESTRQLVSSPKLLPPLNKTFCLLVSALMDAALFSDEKANTAEMRHLSSIWLLLVWHWMKTNKSQDHPDALFIPSPADNMLFSFCVNSIYSLSMLLLTFFFFLWTKTFL